VAKTAEEIIRNFSLEKKALPKKQGKRCGNELDIEIIDLAVNVDHVHLFIKSGQKGYDKIEAVRGEDEREEKEKKRGLCRWL